MKQNIFNTQWYHGTDVDQFNEWQIPPPFYKQKIIAHKGIYFTTNKEFAEAVGPNIAAVKIDRNAKILNTLTDLKMSEKLRKELCKQQLFKSLENSKQYYWINGWKDGSILRPAFLPNTFAEHQYISYFAYYTKHHPTTDPKFAAGQHLTRELIEIISAGAKSMGFDGIYGHEIDRWNKNKQVIAVPWLCILNKEIISQPKWIG